MNASELWGTCSSPEAPGPSLVRPWNEDPGLQAVTLARRGEGAAPIQFFSCRSWRRDNAPRALAAQWRGAEQNTATPARKKQRNDAAAIFNGKMSPPLSARRRP